jgi:hypothetical protein
LGIRNSNQGQIPWERLAFYNSCDPVGHAINFVVGEHYIIYSGQLKHSALKVATSWNLLQFVVEHVEQWEWNMKGVRIERRFDISMQ